MRWSIRNQILVPFAILQIAAVAALTLLAVLFSIRRVERDTDRRLESVVTTLRESSFPLTKNVLQQMSGLSGAEFAVVNDHQQVAVSTLSGQLSEIPQAAITNHSLESVSFHEGIPVESDGRRFLSTRVSGLGAGAVTDLLILFPEEQWQEARRDAAIVPLIIGGVTICGMMAVSAWLASRFGRRMRSIEQQFARMADGDFEPIALGRRDDELRDLSRSANQLAAALQRMAASIRQQERQTLVSQLAGGLAHQLRNAITGARMAIQLHRRRCQSIDDESLDVALRQLSLTEQQIKGLLRLTRDPRHSSTPPELLAGNLRGIVEEVAFLVGPMCEHEHIELDVAVDVPPWLVIDRDAMCAAILNLVLNAIEAAGPRGTVAIAAHAKADQVVIEISDTGPGIAEELSETLFDPFVTSKPEGVGLGLLLAVEAAGHHGGRLTCRRENDRTVFSMLLAARETDGAAPQTDTSTSTSKTADTPPAHSRAVP